MNSSAPSKKEQSHRRIVEAASRTMRRSGFGRVSVAEVMSEAGMTHGGFYAHFPSRDGLLSEALIHASQESAERITTHVDTLLESSSNKFHAFVETYLYEGQIVDCENGCPVGALCSEMRNQVSEVQVSSRQAITNLYKLVDAVMPAGHRTAATWAVVATLTGALQLARAMGDNQQGRAILTTAKAELFKHYQIS